MISPELLRHYPFFGLLDDPQLNKIAMLAEEKRYQRGSIVFREGKPATALYFLLEGSVDLYYTLGGLKHDVVEKGISVGEINPGEPFGISALIEPHLLTSTASVSVDSRAIEIDAAALRSLFEDDRRMAYLFIHQAARSALERLNSTRVQLAAAWV